MLLSAMCCRRRDGLPHQCAHWFAMTGLVGVRAPVHGCNARRFCQGCGLPHHLSALVRNDIHKPGRLAHLRARVKCTTFLPKCVLAMRTRSKFLHVIARSEATWQSASPQKMVRRNRTWGEFAAGYGFALGAAFRSVLLQGERIATSRCSRPAPRNDRQKT